MDFQKVYQVCHDLNILYVEDDVKTLREVTEILEMFFASVKGAQNGQRALDIYLEDRDKYDLIITDINMPVMDGIELIRRVHEVDVEQPFIVVSAYDESEKLIKLIQNGISNFILKPISSGQLNSTLYKVAKSIQNQKHLIKYKDELEELNLQLDFKVQEQAKEIRLTQEISIEAIANMVESYDDDTGTHVKRIKAYCEIMVQEIQEDDMIPFASILHDIGKLMVSKKILTKPAKLTQEEFEHIKMHAVSGGDVLLRANQKFSDICHKDSFLKTASDIAMYHHERYDGKGYPKGLKGDEIPIAARIVSIADVYDALRSKRVYKEEFTHEKAYSIIKNERGKAFDPKLVDMFIQYNKSFDEVFNALY